MKVLLFGAGKIGKKYYNFLSKKTDVTILGFIDNNEDIIGRDIYGSKIMHVDEINKYDFDKIIITATSIFASKIFDQLKALDIPSSKIELADCYDIWAGYDEETNPRVRWLRDFAANHIYKNNLPGDVAECGVSRGQFARYINKYFPDRMLYLFDTFDGFVSSDLDKEKSFNNQFFNTSEFATNGNIFKDISVEHLMEYMPFPQNCIIKKGYFPDTAIDISDLFSFVNLDMDLYQPMLAALNIFWNRIIPGGVILVHDYYHLNLPGVAKSVADFESIMKKRICKIPIGDFCSIALIKD